MTENNHNTYTFDKLIRTGLSVLGAAFCLYLIYILRTVLIPFGIAFLLAYLINPMVGRLEAYWHNRKLAVFVTLFLLTFIVTGIGLLLIPILADEIMKMGPVLQQLTGDGTLREQFEKIIPSAFWAPIAQMLEQDRIIDVLQNGQTIDLLKGLFTQLLPGAVSIFSGTARFLIALLSIFLVLLYLIFMLLDFSHLKVELKELVPVAYQEKVFTFIHNFDEAMHRYFRAQSLIALTVGVLFAIGFRIIDLPMAIGLGLFIGLLNMIPYLQIVGIIPAAFLAVVSALQQGNSIPLALVATLSVFAVVQMIQDGFLVPKIMGNITGLSPVMVLLSISVWGELLGFLGLVIAIPFTCLFLAYYQGMQQKTRNTTILKEES
jgi:predicted PurR-regulated permease PerM